jgi:hypothetical protein
MRLLLVALAFPIAAAAQSIGCEQRLITPWSGSGDLAFSSTTSAEGTRELHLHYVGPMESEVGRVWPMATRRLGRTIEVSIARHSVPVTESGATLPTIGRNRGSVKLPTMAPGNYELVIRHGAGQHSRHSLEVSAEGLRVRTLHAAPGLQIAAERWRAVGPHQRLVIARCSGSDAACARAYDAQLISDSRLEEGAWLDAPWAPDACVLREPEGGFPPLPDDSMLTLQPLSR